MKKFFVFAMIVLLCASFTSAQVLVNGRAVKNGQVKIKFKEENRESFTLYASVDNLNINQFDFEWCNDVKKVIGNNSKVSIPIVLGFQYYVVYLTVTRKDLFFSKVVKIILKAEKPKIKIDYN